jgi:hypothetical protein
VLKEGEEEGATEDDLGEELESSLALAEDEQGGPSLGFILGTCTNTLNTSLEDLALKILII